MEMGQSKVLDAVANIRPTILQTFMDQLNANDTEQ
jgi:hypothetical protein